MSNKCVQLLDKDNNVLLAQPYFRQRSINLTLNEYDTLALIATLPATFYDYGYFGVVTVWANSVLEGKSITRGLASINGIPGEVLGTSGGMCRDCGGKPPMPSFQIIGGRANNNGGLYLRCADGSNYTGTFGSTALLQVAIFVKKWLSD